MPLLDFHIDIPCDLGHITSSSGPHAHMSVHRCAPWVCGDETSDSGHVPTQLGLVSLRALSFLSQPCQAPEHMTQSQALVALGHQEPGDVRTHRIS